MCRSYSDDCFQMVDHQYGLSLLDHPKWMSQECLKSVGPFGYSTHHSRVISDPNYLHYLGIHVRNPVQPTPLTDLEPFSLLHRSVFPNVRRRLNNAHTALEKSSVTKRRDMITSLTKKGAEGQLRSKIST